MPIAVRAAGTARIIELQGDFTLIAGGLAAPRPRNGRHLSELVDALRALLDEGCRRIVLDLSRVTALDSAGLGEIMACRKRTLEAGGRICLLRPMGRLRTLLENIQLMHLFPIFDEEAEALASFDA